MRKSPTNVEKRSQSQRFAREKAGKKESPLSSSLATNQEYASLLNQLLRKIYPESHCSKSQRAHLF